jgi:AcrR family transcriptional regulator
MGRQGPREIAAIGQGTGVSTVADKRAARLPREQRINEILHAARDVFCERGYENTAVSEIAARLGVVEGTIYKYFDSKRELLLKTLANWYDELFGDFSRELAGISGARQRLRYAVWRHLCTIHDYPKLCRLIFGEVRSQPDYRESELYVMNRRYASLLMNVVQDGIRSGEFRSGISLPLIRDLVFGGVEHHAWSYLYGHGELDVDQLADQITSLLCDGILNRRAADDLSQHTRRLSAIADRLEQTLNGPKRSRKAS